MVRSYGYLTVLVGAVNPAREAGMHLTGFVFDFLKKPECGHHLEPIA